MTIIFIFPSANTNHQKIISTVNSLRLSDITNIIKFCKHRHKLSSKLNIMMPVLSINRVGKWNPLGISYIDMVRTCTIHGRL